MAPASPRLGDLPEAFAVFPLAGALLLPRGRLPLNVFEPRYLAMVEDSLGAGRMIGMIQPDTPRACTAAGPALYRIGCLGRVSAFSETDDGRFLITLTGVIRFSVAEELPCRRGYRRVRAELAPFAADLAPLEQPAALDRAGLLADLRGYFAQHGIDANWDAIGGMADDALVTTLSMVCPFDPPEKQALLEAPGEAERASTLRTLLAIDTHTNSRPRSTLAS
jgi:Lon protease-like protein